MRATVAPRRLGGTPQQSRRASCGRSASPRRRSKPAHSPRPTPTDSTLHGWRRCCRKRRSSTKAAARARSRSRWCASTSPTRSCSSNARRAPARGCRERRCAFLADQHAASRLPRSTIAVVFAGGATMQTPVVDAFASLLRADPAAPVAWTATGARDRQSLAAAADQIGTLLAREPPGGRLAVSLRDGFLFLAAVLAVWRRGSCVILLDAADPRAPRKDLARELGAGALLHLDSEWRCEHLGAMAPAHDLAAIKLTSGSTGRPRGVGVGFAELIADAEALEHSMGIGAHDRVFAAVPMSFSYGVGSLLVPALWRGRELVLPDPSHPLGLMQALRNGAPTVLPAVPALLRALLGGAFELPPSVRLVLSAGAALAPSVAAAFHRRFDRRVHAFYGATEA